MSSYYMIFVLSLHNVCFVHQCLLCLFLHTLTLNSGNQSSGCAKHRLRNLWDCSYALTLNTESNFRLKKQVIIVPDNTCTSMQYIHLPSCDPQTHLLTPQPILVTCSPTQPILVTYPPTLPTLPMQFTLLRRSLQPTFANAKYLYFYNNLYQCHSLLH